MEDSRIDPLLYNNERELWPVRAVVAELAESFLELRHFVRGHVLHGAVTNTITKHYDRIGQSTVHLRTASCVGHH